MAERRREMRGFVVSAVTSLGETSGSSVIKIIKFIKQNLLQADSIVKYVPTVTVMKVRFNSLTNIIWM